MAAEQEPVYLFVAENATTCRKILERGGCDRCALRHCAPPWALYDAAPATLRGALRSALDVPQNEGCSLCLGALAETTARAVARAATAHAGLGAARGWALRVAAPPAWAVRDAAVVGCVEINQCVGCMLPCWLCRCRGGRRDDSARTRRKI